MMYSRKYPKKPEVKAEEKQPEELTKEQKKVIAETEKLAKLIQLKADVQANPELLKDLKPHLKKALKDLED